MDPTSVWLFYHPGPEVVAERSQRIFQRILTHEDYVNLVGALTGEMVYVSLHRHEISPDVFIPMIFVELTRFIRTAHQRDRLRAIYSLHNEENGPEITLQNFQVPPMAQGKGLGTRTFATQVQEARNFGFDSVIASAVGGKILYPHRRSSLEQSLIDDGIDFVVEEDERNGYYTWPRLGFDKILTDNERSRLPVQFANATNLSDLMETSEGRKWWCENGFTVEVTFDVSLKSRSMKALNAALERLDQEGKFWESGPEMPLFIEQGPHGRPRHGWQERRWEYRPKQ